MENHLAREEVKAALATGSGTSFRYSDTLMERYIYTAQRLSDGTVLRLSAAQNTVPHLVLGVVKPIILVIGIAVALSALLAGQLTKNIVAPLNELNLDDPMSNREYVEIQPLLRRLDSQQVQLRAQSQELRQKQKEFNTVTRSLSEGLVLMNSSGMVLSINPAATRLLEITPNCLGADFGVANRNAAISALVEKALTGEKAEENVALTGGEYLAAASPVKSDGAVSGVVLLLFDVTQKQKAEALRREFTANVSHELKTPLHAISGLRRADEGRAGSSGGHPALCGENLQRSPAHDRSGGGYPAPVPAGRGCGGYAVGAHRPVRNGEIRHAGADRPGGAEKRQHSAGRDENRDSGDSPAGFRDRVQPHGQRRQVQQGRPGWSSCGSGRKEIRPFSR